MTSPVVMAVLMFMTHAIHTRAVRAESKGRPNIVLIMADDMGYGDASCYGNTAYKTPHIDRLAAGGMRFTDFHSSGPVCSPTRAGLLTGRYQQRAGIPGVINADPKVNRHHGLHPKETTFAELLKPAGYATGIFGKWHLGYRKRFNPVHHGFNRFRGYVSGNVDYISHVDRMGVADWWDGDKLITEKGYSTHLITRHAVAFIRAHRDRPFCLYVAHEAVHAPYQGPKDRAVRAPGQGRIPGATRRDVKAAYREMMTEMDKGVGEIVATLQALKLERKTLVIFFSDNGANRNGSNGRLRGFKGSVWEGGHRVPAVAYWPGTIKPGTLCAQPAISLDLMPTMLELAGAKTPERHKLDGVSLAPVLTGKGEMPKRVLFWEYRRKSAVRQGPWKLVLGERGLKRKPALFHLVDDPGETTNLAPKHAERVRKLRRLLSAWRTDVAKGATRQPKRADRPSSP
ncbi:MAG: sulfatase-like hydrolase/transferase [Planctomycetaceae bacterium]